MYWLVQFLILNIQCMVTNHLKLQQKLIKVKKPFIIIERPGSIMGSNHIRRSIKFYVSYQCKESDDSVMKPSLFQYISLRWLLTNEVKYSRRERTSRLYRGESLKSQMLMPLQGNFSDHTADCNCWSHRQTFRSIQEHPCFTTLPPFLGALHFLPLLTITTFFCKKQIQGHECNPIFQMEDLIV